MTEPRWQLRDYAIKPDEMDDWIAEWRAKIVPLRRRFGFEVAGAWRVQGADRFVWIINYNGERPWKEMDLAYYESAERKRMDPDPARHIAHSDTRFVDPLEP
ncbi:MAG TPA: NIPSNAP family protein [Candidatus Dormibacteraeota bacterium]|nr:NIPSNAP family protein [Candidatus Dormibacteraeota bacterium]